MPKDVLAKVYMPLNVIFMGMFLHASFVLETTGPAPGNILPFNLWWTQLPIAAFMLYANVQALGECSADGGKKSS